MTTETSTLKQQIIEQVKMNKDFSVRIMCLSLLLKYGHNLNGLKSEDNEYIKNAIK